MLIKQGADLDLRNDKGETALHFAVNFGQIGLAKVLIEAGADKTVANADGNTVLTIAQQKGMSEMVEMLG